MKSRDLVIEADKRLFNQHDLSVLEELFAADFIEHSPFVTGDARGLGEFVESCGKKLKHDVARVLSNGEYVLLHGAYQGIEDEELVGFDLYRVENGRLAEHWDSLVPKAAPNASGRTQLDGTTEPDYTFDSDKAVEFVKRFFKDFLIDQNYDHIHTYTDGNNFEQHASDIPDGADEMADALIELKNNNEALVYTNQHRAIGFGNFVLTQTDGEIAGERHAFYELWRVEDVNGELKVAELWDAISPLPQDSEMKHSHGGF